MNQAESPPEDPKEVSDPQARLMRSVKLCLGFAVVTVLVFAIAKVIASQILDGRIAQLEKDLAAFEETFKGPRPVLLGEPVKGNAVWDYRAVEWVLDPRPAWRNNQPKNLPEIDLPMGSPFNGDQMRLLMQSDFSLRNKAVLPQGVDELWQRYGSLLRHVRAGLRREECHWDYTVHRLYDSKYDPVAVHSNALIDVALLMQLEAQTATPDDAALIALEIIAYGQDLSRHPADTVLIKSIGVKEVGFRTLERVLNRDLRRESLEKVVQVLGAVGVIDLRRGLKALTLGLQAMLARLRDQLGSGSKNAATEDWAELKPFGLRLRSTIFLAWEWRLCTNLFADIDNFVQLPYSQRMARVKALGERARDSRSVFAKVAVPSALQLLQGNEESNVRQDLVRMLAAAQLYRLDQGQFPEEASKLEKYLGGAIPKDPYIDNKETLRVKKVANELICYSCYVDQKDDQGKNYKDVPVIGEEVSGDLVFRATAPK